MAGSISRNEVDSAIRKLPPQQVHNVISLAADKKELTAISKDMLRRSMIVYNSNGTAADIQTIKKLASHEPDVHALNIKDIVDIILTDLINYFDEWDIGLCNFIVILRAGAPAITIVNFASIGVSGKEVLPIRVKKRSVATCDWSGLRGSCILFESTDVRRHLHALAEKMGRGPRWFDVSEIQFFVLCLLFSILAVLVWAATKK